MLKHAKSQLRDLLPRRLQVPAKYWYGRLLHRLEREMELLAHIVSERDLVIDVGGNRGIYSYYLAMLGARIEVFEPNPVCHEILRRWANGRAGINLHAVALSNREGSAQLHIPVDDSGVEHDASASIENLRFARSRDQTVSLRTLDSFHFDDVRLVKIDVEGHEHDVIEGAATTLASSKPALLVEIEQRHHSRPIGDIFELIQGFGYRGLFLGEHGLTGLERFAVERQQSLANFQTARQPYINNFLFLHRARLENGEYRELLKGQPVQ